MRDELVDRLTMAADMVDMKILIPSSLLREAADRIKAQPPIVSDLPPEWLDHGTVIPVTPENMGKLLNLVRKLLRRE